jgi:MSHA biogenesis protein MshN
MRANDSAQAITLLSNEPPVIAADTEYHELLASAYQQGGNHPQAVATYRDLLRVDRDQGRWWAGLGISLEAQSMLADALTSFQAALQTTNLDAGLRQYVQSRVPNLGKQQ